MRLFLLGATGRTGRRVIEQALSRGHTVTAAVRAPGALQSHPRLDIAAVDPLNADVLASALVGHEAVISCLGQKSRRDAYLLQNAARAVVHAMTRLPAGRLLVVSQGLLFHSRNPIIPMLRLILARHVADSIAMERLVSASGVDWTIVRPPRLLEGGASRGYRIEEGTAPKGAWSMQRIDLAAFLLDAAERREHVRRIVGITSG